MSQPPIPASAPRLLDDQDVIGDLVGAASAAEAHCAELREAWQTGALSSHDGKNGLRSNRNVDVEIALRNALHALLMRVADDINNKPEAK